MNRFALAALLPLAACQSQGPATDGSVPGDAQDTRPYAGIGETELVRFAGTEPFWGGSLADTTLIWSTPDNIEGTTIPVTRFAGRGGLTVSGVLDGAQMDMAITPGACSDGMSERTYPFIATVKLGAQDLSGCAWREGDDLGEAP
jgi:uncharacterized membrane protein